MGRGLAVAGSSSARVWVLVLVDEAVLDVPYWEPVVEEEGGVVVDEPYVEEPTVPVGEVSRDVTEEPAEPVPYVFEPVLVLPVVVEVDPVVAVSGVGFWPSTGRSVLTLRPVVDPAVEGMAWRSTPASAGSPRTGRSVLTVRWGVPVCIEGDAAPRTSSRDAVSEGASVAAPGAGSIRTRSPIFSSLTAMSLPDERIHMGSESKKVWLAPASVLIVTDLACGSTDITVPVTAEVVQVEVIDDVVELVVEVWA